ncbi:MAG: hypothetical protein ABI197_00450 [Granulicella sp.]
MALQWKNLFFGLLGIAGTACGAGAQVRSGAAESNLRAPVTVLQAVVGPQSTLEDELKQMSAEAGVIFAGQVLSVKRQEDAGSGSGFVDVKFHVEEAIRGCVAGATYELREWTGLWAVGSERYRVGQRLLMLLHAPGASGLSSPVGGQDGVIPITGAAAAPGPSDDFVGQGEQAVDLRWVQTRLLRSAANGGRLGAEPVAASETVYVGREHRPMVTRKNPASPSAARTNFIKGPEEFVADPAGAAALTESAPLQGVLAMLGAWETRQTNAAQ